MLVAVSSQSHLRGPVPRGYAKRSASLGHAATVLKGCSARLVNYKRRYGRSVYDKAVFHKLQSDSERTATEIAQAIQSLLKVILQ